MMNYFETAEERNERLRGEADSHLRRSGFVRDEYGHYSDPSNPTRTGAWVDPYTGQICRDM